MTARLFPIALTAALLVAAARLPAAAAVPTFDRPLNGDCVRVQSLASGAAGSLYPEKFFLEGDSTTTTPEGTTQITSAKGFSVEYFPTYKVVNNSDAGETYVLCQCGATCPSPSQFPTGTKFFTIPLTAVSSPETVPYAYLEMLGVTDRVQGVSPLAVSSCGQRLVACDRTAPDAFSGELQNATFLAAELTPYVDGLLTSSPSNYTKAFAFSAATDPGSLARAEWIKFLGLFFNRERAASDIYAAIESQYNATRDAAAKAAGVNLPVVAWVQAFEYDGEENWQISFAPYKANLTTDAGGVMISESAVTAIPGVVYPDSFGSPNAVFGWNTTNYNVTFPSKAAAQAAFAKALQAADVIIDETYAMDETYLADPSTYNLTVFLNAYGITPEQAKLIPALNGSKARVYREDGLTTAAGSLDWFEGALARPDAVLADLFRVLHPDAVKKPEDFTWLRHISQAPTVLTADGCTSLPASCAVSTAAICPFVSDCPGATPAILQSDDNGTCVYATCGASPSAATTGAVPQGAAVAAAPAVLLTLAVVAFVEIMMHFC